MPEEEANVEAALAVINIKLDYLIEQRLDQENRIRSLEQFKWKVLGSTGILAVIGGALAGTVVDTLVK